MEDADDLLKGSFLYLSTLSKAGTVDGSKGVFADVCKSFIASEFDCLTLGAAQGKSTPRRTVDGERRTRRSSHLRFSPSSERGFLLSSPLTSQ